jgi:TrmH family RNA methyltransferase
LIGNSIDPFDPQVVRATMGSLFALRLVRTDEASFARWREKHDVTLMGTSPHATADYHQFSYPERTVLWLVGEGERLGKEQLAACDQVVQIPSMSRLPAPFSSTKSSISSDQGRR